ncbi:group 1 glycosyl transferase, partial [bacterium]|nr:group 1 glycosyl transferase [bacterium]
MKVLQVNAVSGYGSTGRICVELSEGLIALGHQAFIAYSHGVSSFPDSFRFGDTLEQKKHALLSRITGLQGYFSPRGTRDLIEWIKREEPDIVHLHNLHSNDINIIQLLGFLGSSNISTVVTLHDCWFFTGKCTHFTEDNCYQWENHCKKCPRLKKDNPSYFFDRTEKMFHEKRNAFDEIKNLGVIGVSDWITGIAKRSYLN